MKDFIRKQLFKSLLLPVLFLMPAVSSYAQKKKTDVGVRVLSYNIHHCNPPSRAKEGLIDIQSIAKVIRDSKADLVALQEVDVHTARSGKDVHQARELAKLTGMHAFFVKTIDHQGGDYGIAVLSKYPILDSAAYKLPMQEGSGGEPRGLAVITVQLKGGKKLRFASTHLDLKVANKPLQAAELIRLLDNGKTPVILGGDFNSVPDSEVISILDKAFTRTCTGNCGFTIPEVNPNRTIDYIMFRKPGQLEVLSHQVINEPYASDHLPIVAEFKVK